MADRAAKDALFDAFTEVTRALANGRRAEIVDVLAQGERSVDDIAAEIGQTTPNTSHHLRVLARAGLVATRRAGTRIYYRLASDEVERLWSVLRDVAARQVAGIERLVTAYVGERNGLEAIGRDELDRRLESGDVVVIDVRPEAEYDAGHVRGARSIPPERLRDELSALPTDLEVVAYCRGQYCAYADEAVRELRHRGFAARRLEDGFPEWRRAGLPTATVGDSA
jgi:rhodanese-related sulfurtransferase/DNA-binding HxlR family transcriptional regulator